MFPIAFLRQAALTHPEVPAAIDGTLVCSYRELMARSDALAAGMQALTAKRRPTVAILGPNSVDMLVVLMSVHAGGGILVPLNGRNAKPQLDAQIARARPDVVLVHREYLDKFSHNDNLVIVVNAVAGDARAMSLVETQYAGHRAEWEASLGDANSIKFTGGSSGVPKGVVQSFRCINTVIASVLFAFEFTKSDRFLCAAPMTHGAGAFLLPILAKGGTVILTSDLTPGHLLDLMEREQITTTWIPPTLLYKLIDEQKTLPRSLSLTHLIWGGATASPQRIREAQQVFGEVVETSFGQTEAPLILSAARRHEVLDEQRIASVGRVLPLSEVAIFDADGNRSGPNQAGEICARGDLVMNGYFEMPAETASTIRDGWLHTGDVGLIDDDGFLYVKDRIRDVVITGGFNVYPSDVEAAISLHPAVSEVVVFGVPDRHWGERLEAALELRSGHRATEKELIAFCKERVGSVQAPKSIRIVESLPRSPVGKVLRREAKAMSLGAESSTSVRGQILKS